MLYTILGCLVESLGMIVVTVPLLYPVLLRFGIDPIWFGVILVPFVEMGQISALTPFWCIAHYGAPISLA